MNDEYFKTVASYYFIIGILTGVFAVIFGIALSNS